MKKCATICTSNLDTTRNGSLDIPKFTRHFKYKQESSGPTAHELLLQKELDPGFYFGPSSRFPQTHYIGLPQGREGNLIAIGGNGSGKSSGIAIPTLETWRGALCATDIKGELSSAYARLVRTGKVTRPYLIFDPSQSSSPSYDPFWLLLEDGEEKQITNVLDMALTLFPSLPGDIQPFWVETERSIFAAALLYYVQLGLSFSETLSLLVTTPLSSLCQTLTASGDAQIHALLGEVADIKSETLAALDRGLRNKLIPLATDPYITHAFRGSREHADTFCWKDLEAYNIFLRIPASRIEQWGPAVNLMYTQLIRYLQRRPDQYTPDGRNNLQTLLLMDEVAQMGKLDLLPTALSTLRSKNVNICLMVQSIAQLDRIYGEQDRRILLDNCQYQAVLRANDADTQAYLCKRIGTCCHLHCSVGSQLDRSLKKVTGFSYQISEVRNWTVQPHTLATLDKILLLAPEGFFEIEKFQPTRPGTAAAPLSKQLQAHSNEVSLMTLQERTRAARAKVSEEEYRRRVADKRTQAEKKKLEQRRYYIVGQLVTEAFPELEKLVPASTDVENQVNFGSLIVCLDVLKQHPEWINQMKAEVARERKNDRHTRAAQADA